MRILAHRGYWNQNIANNSPQALRTALEHGYGFESDLRDYEGRLVISHNIAQADSQCADEVFRWLAEYEDRYCFAINIKADGLKELIRAQLLENGLSNYFLFDMSVPQMIEFAEMGLRFYTRQSEVEVSPTMYDKAAGVWIDGFWDTDWITEELLRAHIDNGKEICLVSPDLHKREYKAFWAWLASCELDFAHVALCTDHPDEAAEFFANKL